MSELSRPFQLALVGVVGLALIWFVALRPHGGPEGSPSSSSPHSSVATGPAQSNPAAPTPIYHGVAPGVEGLSKAISKAHGAVATSQQNAAELQSKSAQASGEASLKPSGPSAARSSSSPSVAARAKSQAKTTSRKHAHQAHRRSRRARPSQGARSGVQMVKSDLAHGKLVLLLFWNPRAVDDVEVYRQLQAAHHMLGRKVAVHKATAEQLGSYGSITQHIQINETPTILIINRHQQVSVLTGLTDAFAIDQAVSEAAHSR